MNTSVGHRVAEQTAEKVRSLACVESATVEQNHKGPYVQAVVSNRRSESEMYDRVGDFPAYIEIVVDDA